MSVTEETRQLNGWDLDSFEETVETVRENPEAGKLTFRSSHRWDGGFAVEGHPREIEQLGETIRRRFTLPGDHPPELLGQDTGPTAVETLLAALGSCMAGTYAAQATSRGVEIEQLEVELEGAIDLNGFLQLAPVRAGLPAIQARFRVKSDADEETLRELEEATRGASPVYDTVSHPVEISASVERMA